MPEPSALFDHVCRHVRQTALLATAAAALEWDERTMMPPGNAEYRAEQTTLLSGMIHERWTDEAFVGNVAELAAGSADDGAASDAAVTIRRLNRSEYNNTIRDLVGVDFQPAEDFPSDDVGHGFDNIGDVLTLSPILVERYLAAAESIMQRAIVPTPPKSPAAVQRCLPVSRSQEITSPFLSVTPQSPPLLTRVLLSGE